MIGKKPLRKNATAVQNCALLLIPQQPVDAGAFQSFALVVVIGDRITTQRRGIGIASEAILSGRAIFTARVERLLLEKPMKEEDISAGDPVLSYGADLKSEPCSILSSAGRFSKPLPGRE